MLKKVSGREYPFREWVRLTRAEKREVMKRRWDPRRPEIGEATRASVLQAFAQAHAQLLKNAVARTAYFSAAGWSIAVVVADASVRVPTAFDAFRVVKGITNDPSDPCSSVTWLSR